jgi:hypothetical protein
MTWPDRVGQGPDRICGQALAPVRRAAGVRDVFFPDVGP